MRSGLLQCSPCLVCANEFRKGFPPPPPSSPPLDYPVSRKRKANQPDYLPPPKRVQSSPETAEAQTTLREWLSNLPNEEDFEDQEIFEAVNDMSQPTSKRSRSRSSDSLGRGLSPSGDGSETAISREKKYSVYRDGNYKVVLETKGSFMKPSKAGMVKEDKELCESLLWTTQPIFNDALFSDDHFDKFHSNLRGRSEARICLDLHPRLMPSVENLYICGREEFAGLIEGHNDPWVKSIPFYGPRPQPDHTYGFKWSNFTRLQRRKLMIEPTKKSFYAAREDIYFPFLTAEVKCGKQGLDLADKPNIHSMTIQMRGIVDLYRKINRPNDVHGRVLGFSISHDDNGERIHAYYPEIDGDETTYWRETLKEFGVGSDNGKDRWTSHRFTLNVCQMFALPLVERLKTVIDELPDPLFQSLELAATFEDVSVQRSQSDLSVSEFQDEKFKKPRNVRVSNAELRNMIQMLQRQVERQAEDANRQQRDAKERETLLLAQLEQQQKKSEHQLNEVMGMLKDQRATSTN